MIPDQVTTFKAFSPEHFVALWVTLMVGAGMVFAARTRHRGVQRTLELVVATLLCLQWPLNFLLARHTGVLTVDNSYPCHFCDFAALLGVLVLVTHKRFFCELLYFWGLAGTLQGLITPALSLNWPHPRFVLFFIIHSGVVITALYGVLGLRVIPRASAKWTAWLWMLGYGGMVGFFNWLVGSNYGFTCRKPDTASLFDALGPWPWYLVVTGLLGIVLFIILDLPFMRIRRRA